MTRFICLSKQEAIKELKKYGREWFSKRKSLWSLVKESFMNEPAEAQNNDAITKSAECDAAIEMISGGMVSAGYYTSAIILWDQDAIKLEEKTASIEEIINSAGFITINESFNAVQAWLSTLPGHCWANVRRPIMHSLNLCHLLPVSTDWAGPEKNSHLNGPPLFYAQTSGGTAFRFCNHVGDVGHTMIIGPTGTGKSVLLSFIAAQFQRYKGAQVFIFDKDYSAKCITKAMNGRHYDIGGSGSRLSFQPFRQIHQPDELEWSLEWLVNLLRLECVKINPKKKT
ncbi:hypothetical protein GMMP15_1780006 [Candidatus Magnetomoraceae bacterium gMMP-15]